MKAKITALVALSMLAASVHAKMKEKDYQALMCPDGFGVMEYKLIDNRRVDCLTSTHAIEVDFAYKWFEAVGQSLHYAKMTGKRAGVYLIMIKDNDEKHLRQMKELIRFYDLPIDVIEK